MAHGCTKAWFSKTDAKTCLDYVGMTDIRASWGRCHSDNCADAKAQRFLHSASLQTIAEGM